MPRIAAALPSRPTRRNARGTGPPAGARARFSESAMAEMATAAHPSVNGRAAPPPVVEVRDLKTHFAIHHGFLRRAGGKVFAVDGVSFSIAPQETLGLVGE